MTSTAEAFTIGVEEEYQLVDGGTGELRSESKSTLQEARERGGEEVEPELYLSQVESGTSVCHTLAELRSELVRLRRQLASAAEENGSRVVATGTHPFSHWREQEVTPKERYRTIVRDYQQLAREQIICGCHVHVGIVDREAAVRVMSRCRPWLAPLLALGANSPFWLARDSGYASFGREMWRRWPMAGLPPLLETRAEYDDLVDALVSTGSIREPTKIYWDVRPSERYQTLEFRVTDVCMTVDEAVMIAGLTRALAQTCYADDSELKPDQQHRELLVAANWRASRYGLEGELIDVEGRRAVPARELVHKLLGRLRPMMEEREEWDELATLVHATVEGGNGATRQRGALERRGRLEDVVTYVADQTVAG